LHQAQENRDRQKSGYYASSALRYVGFRMTLTYSFSTTLEQGNIAYIPTLTPPLWKKKEQCTVKQLQLRALKNLQFSQVSFFYAVNPPPPQPKQNNSTTRPSPNVVLPLYCSQNKTT